MVRLEDAEMDGFDDGERGGRIDFLCMDILGWGDGWMDR